MISSGLLRRSPYRCGKAFCIEAVMRQLQKRFCPIQLTEELIDGTFNAMYENFGRLSDEGTCPLGTLTFNQMGPKDLIVRLQIFPAYFV